MTARGIILWALVLGFSARPGGAGPAEEAAPAATVLTPGSIVTVNARLGMLTSVTIRTKEPLENVLKGGPEINELVDGNVIHIQPTVAEGLSSLTFRVGGSVYVIRVRISPGDLVQPNPVFTVADAGKLAGLDRPLAEAAALRPGEIDLNGAVRAIERADRDPAFRETLRNFAELPVRKVYSWNGQDIHFLSAYQFAELDLIVFRISWVNTQAAAFYLKDQQYQIYLGERPVPIQARRQLAARAIVFPGQQDTVWLAVQGYKLRLDNPWELRLPADARMIQALLGR